MSRHAKWGLGLALAVLAYTIGGFVVLPSVLKSQLEAKLPPLLKRNVSIERIAFNPFTLTLTVTGFKATEPDGSTFASFQEFLANLESSSLFQRSLNFQEVSLTAPTLEAFLLPEGRTNFENIGSDSQADTAQDKPASEAAKPSRPLQVHITKLSVTEGSVHFEDTSRDQPYKTTIGPIRFEVSNFKTDPDWTHAHTFTAKMDPNTLLAWSGSFSVAPFWSEGTMELTGVQLKSFTPYYPEHFTGQVLSGEAAVRFDYRIDTANKALALQIQRGTLDLLKFAVAEDRAPEPIISLPKVSLAGIDVNLEQHRASAESLTIAGSRLAAVRDPQGVINLTTLFTPSSAGSDAPAPDHEPKAASPPWQVSLEQIQLQDITLSLQDRVPPKPVTFTLDQLALTLRNVRYPESQPIDTALSFRWNEQGTVGLTGELFHTPVAASLDVKVSDFPLPPFQPYLAKQAHITLAKGTVDLRGHVEYNPPESSPLLRYTGNIGLTNLLTKDTRSADPLVKWDALRFTDLDVQVQPTRIAAEQVHLKNFSAQGTINAKGEMNLASLSRANDEGSTAAGDTAATPPQQSAPSPTIAIKNVIIENAGLSLADQSIHPILMTGINHLTGRIQNVTYPGLSKMTIDLTAKADSRAPIHITGQAEPKGKDSLLDLNVSLKGYDVPAFTGYSGKYVGFPIEKGKLSLDLKYDLAERKVRGENTLRIDQLTLGEKTDSPEATSLPVKLALGILTDRKGQIELDVPVSGSLDDPEFTLGRVILRALVNILEKVATSPFALLGAIAGSDDSTLSDITFEPGRSQLSASESAKLDTLATALQQRPSLTLEVHPSVDPAEDVAALKRQKLRTLLRHKKLAAMKPQPAGGDSHNAAVDEITLDEAEYETMVRELHASLMATTESSKPDAEVTLEDLPPPPPPPSGFWSMLKKLNPFSSKKDKPTQTPAPPTQASSPPPSGDQPAIAPFSQIEAVILAKQTVSDEDLARLRNDRAEAVHSYLVEHGQLDPNRVFASTAQAAPDAAPSTHATLTLN